MSAIPTSSVFEAKAAAALQTLGLTVAHAQLDSLAQQAAAQAWSYTAFLGRLLDSELAARLEKRVALNLQFAKFPYLKRLAQFDFTAQPSVDRRLIDELSTGRYLGEGRNVLLLGPPGVGKTHLAAALGDQGLRARASCPVHDRHGAAGSPRQGARRSSSS